MRTRSMMGMSGRRALLALAGLASGLVLLAGCSTGAYPVDFFQEMHYSQSVRLQEPSRLGPPEGAVIFSPSGVEGELIALPAWDRTPLTDLIGVTQNPLPNTDVVRQRGAALFTRNCAVCHGQFGNGQGYPIVVIAFTTAGALPPADLTADVTRGKSDGILFFTITHGQGEVKAPADAKNAAAYDQLTNMPAFEKMLTPDDRWALVRHIRTLQGQ